MNIFWLTSFRITLTLIFVELDTVSKFIWLIMNNIFHFRSLFQNTPSKNNNNNNYHFNQILDNVIFVIVLLFM